VLPLLGECIFFVAVQRGLNGDNTEEESSPGVDWIEETNGMDGPGEGLLAGSWTVHVGVERARGFLNISLQWTLKTYIQYDLGLWFIA